MTTVPNALGSITGTPGNSSGLTAIEEWLVKSYLKDRTYETVLANTRYASKKNLPRRSGQYVKFTRRKHMRLPEVAIEGQDNLSGAPLTYEQIQGPMEWINEWTGITAESGATTWMDLANDAKTEIRLALKRMLHYSLQAAFHVGRYEPGHRDVDGATDGGATYKHFWTTAEADPTKWGVAFKFAVAPRYYTGGSTTFNGLLAKGTATNHHNMEDYLKAHVALSNAGAPKIDGHYVAVISDSVKYDLMEDDDYFSAAIRNPRTSENWFAGQIASYRGIAWVMDDEPMTIGANATQGGSDDIGDIRAAWGYNHVSQMFGRDAFGYLRLGGKNAAAGVTFKVQDISKTGAEFTIGYRVPHQAMILNPAWCCEIVGPVSQNAVNNAGVMVPA